MTTPHRDLALVDHWQRSLERSRHRRAITPAMRRQLARRKRASVALSTLMVAGPTGTLLAAAGFGGAGGARVDVAQASPANRAIDSGAAPAAMKFELGSRGEAVAEIQRQLGVSADGVFGPVTHRAVVAFQARNGLDADGIVGPATWTALFGLERAAAAAGAHDADVAVILRERGDGPGSGGPAGAGGDESVDGVGGGSGGRDWLGADRSDGGVGDGGSGRSGGDGSARGGSGSDGRETAAIGGGQPGTARGGDAPATADGGAPKTRPVSAPAPGNGACGPLRLGSPVKGTVTSNFGPRWGRNHDGVDIAAPTGTPIRAAECGIVSFAGAQGGYGNMVCVKHSSRFETCYAHMTRSAVSQGQRVERGQVIGYVGCTGNCTGPHLHFETRVDGSARDPRPYLSGASVPGAPTVKAAAATKAAATSNAKAVAAAAIATDVRQANVVEQTTTAAAQGGGSAWTSIDSQSTEGAPAQPAAPVASTATTPADPAPAQGTSPAAGTVPTAPSAAETPPAPAPDPAPPAPAPAPSPTPEPAPPTTPAAPASSPTSATATPPAPESAAPATPPAPTASDTPAP